MRVVGQSVPRVDGPIKATGQAQYSADLVLPRLLYARALRSPHAHARILNVDVSRALRAPGVKAVLTQADAGGAVLGNNHRLLPGDRTLYIGEELAAVAATDLDAAEEALALIKVEYEPLPPLLDFLRSRSGPALHPEAPDNVAYDIHMHFGDVDRAFGDSDLIKQGTFDIAPSHNCFVEPHVALASYDATGKLTMWSPTQTAHFLRRDLAKVLRLPEGSVRAIATNSGGAFSGRTATLPHHYLAAALSMRTGQPVRMTCTREEEFIIYRGGPAMEVRVKIGCRKDGALTAIQVEADSEAGAYLGTQHTYLYLGGAYCSFPYRVANVKYDGNLMYTNHPPTGTHHGGGIVQVKYAVGLMIDSLAQDLGMDRMELRSRNAMGPGDITASKIHVTSCGLAECISKAGAQSGWPGAQALGVECGGAASGGKSRALNDTSAAIVRLNDDGTAVVLIGISDIGQGSNTVMAQIAAQELGVRIERVRVISADTEITPMDYGAYAQRGTFVTGNAVKEAARLVKEKLLRGAAERLEARPEDMEIDDEVIWVRGSPDRRMAYVEAVAALQTSEIGEVLMAIGTYNSPCGRVDRKTWEGNISGAYSFHAQVARVDFDRETGQTQVVRVVAAHDCGRALNPQSVQGQVEGQVWSGTSQAFYERKVMDGGQVMNPSLLEYRTPTSLDAPPVEVIIVESIDPNGPFGAKECGEGPVITTAPTMGNALQAALGAPVRRFPMGPEEVLEALEGSQA